ncbi:hypothetical protein CKO42_26275, partial [Lamprobacter modestohalophilus]|nr:hypothetical protein [Lamprobacter modestohalophilus]
MLDGWRKKAAAGTVLTGDLQRTFAATSAVMAPPQNEVITMQETPDSAVSFLSRFRGSFTSTLRWHQRIPLWTSLRRDAAARPSRRWRVATGLLLLASLGAESSIAASTCEAPVAVQVLGSGGPEAQQERTSAGYLLWLEGKARVLVDLGGGSFARYGASGAR